MGYYFVNYADDCGFICSDCKPMIEIRQEEEYDLQQNSMLSRKLMEKWCGEDTGHDWKDITRNTLCMGYDVFQCTICDGQKIIAQSMGSFPIDYSRLDYNG